MTTNGVNGSHVNKSRFYIPNRHQTSARFQVFNCTVEQVSGAGAFSKCNIHKFSCDVANIKIYAVFHNF